MLTGRALMYQRIVDSGWLAEPRFHGSGGRQKVLLAAAAELFLSFDGKQRLGLRLRHSPCAAAAPCPDAWWSVDVALEL